MIVYNTYSQIVSPNKVEKIVLEDGKFGKFVIHPLQRGYGTTLGNSLRRVLLSSIRGSVISSFVIEGVDHEFSTIPSVCQDVTQICLNLRNVIIKCEEESADAYIDVTGPKVVTAEDIVVGNGVEVINKQQVLFQIESNVNVRLKLKIKSGIGHIFVDKNSEELIEGTNHILLDCNFSPIKNVSFLVDSTRVSSHIDYDKLTLNIETNGTIDPYEALSVASKLIRDFCNIFADLDAVNLLGESPAKKTTQDVGYNLNLLRRTDSLELSVRSANCLAAAKIEYLGDLVGRSESEMLKMSNFGKKSLEEIKEILNTLGLRFDMDVGVFPPPNMKDLLELCKQQFEN